MSPRIAICYFSERVVMREIQLNSLRFLLNSLRVYFFPSGHCNEFSNLIGSSRGPDFPISVHGNADMSFCPFWYFSAKLYQNSFFIGKLNLKIGPWGDMCLRVTNVTPLTLSMWLLTCFCNGRWQWMLVWKQDGRFCRVPMFSRTGCAGVLKKGFGTLAVDVCQGEK